MDSLIVYSDASTDQTNYLVESFGHDKVSLIVGSERMGKYYGQNRLCETAVSDVLLLLDADIITESSDFITEMVEPFTRDQKIGLVGAKVSPSPSTGRFGKVIDHNHRVKTAMYERMAKNNSNIHLCHGRARAFSKSFYKKFKFISVVGGEDSYSYLMCYKLGFEFYYQSKAVVLFKSPDNFSDYLEQSTRFAYGKREKEKYFDKDVVKKAFKIPVAEYVNALFQSFREDVIKTIAYVFIFSVSILATKLNLVKHKQKWSVSESSNKLIAGRGKKRKMNVITKYFYPVAAGIETNILETSSVLAKKGWDVTIHTSRNTLTEKNKLEREQDYGELKIKRYEYGLLGFFPKIKFDDKTLVCLHNFNLFPHFFILVATIYHRFIRRKKFGLVVIPHGGFNPIWEIFPLHIRVIKRFYHKTIGKLLINVLVDEIRAVSEWELKVLRESGVKVNITVITNGLEDAAFSDVDREASTEVKERVESYGDYIIQIGRIFKIKNQETVIKALKYVPKNINFVIVGPISSYEYETKLKKLAKSLGLEDRVIFAGVVRGVDKYYLIKKAKTMAHMAIWESFCIVVNEGLSQGLVPIVANNYALPYLVKDGVNGFVINTYDYKKLAGKINYVLENENYKKLQTMKRKNKEDALESSWEKTAEKVHNIYMDLFRRLE